jgi:UDP-glucose 6-dehydrogenase
MERQIESWFAFEDGKDMLCKRWDIDKDKIELLNKGKSPI